MTRRAFGIAGAAVLSAAPAAATALEAGSRVLIQAEGREDYAPRVVRCDAPSGLCIRDTRGTPPENPVVETPAGWRVAFESWGVVYLFEPGGSGVVRDAEGTVLGPFRWSQ